MNDISAPEQYDLQTAALKVPPHSIEAEQAVLGGLMLDNNAWERVLDQVSDGDFYRHDHRLIFRAIAKLADQNSPIDVVTLAEQLDKEGQTSQVGGLGYLGELAKNTPSVANIKAYAQIVRQRATLRQLIGISTEIADSAFNPEGRSAEEILDEAERQIFAIAEARPKTGGPVSVNDLLTKAIDRIDTLFNTDNAITGLSTGYTDLDGMTSGLQPADLIIVAGRPSMGKTTFAMNLAEGILFNEDLPVVVFSMEMPAESIVMRLLSSWGAINQTHLRSGQMNEDEWAKMMNAIQHLQSKHLYIDDSTALPPSELRSRCRRIAKNHDGKLGAIIVDYLQLMKVPGLDGNRVGEISEISRSLKALARELECPVIALSQLNRSLENRPNKRPIMSDLRESGAIEQDADLIMFIYRDEVYNENSDHKGVAEIIIGKQRNGPIGTIRLGFEGQFTRFINLTPEYYQNVSFENDE